MTDHIHERVLEAELGISITTLRRWIKAYAHATGSTYTRQAFIDNATADAMRKLQPILADKVVHNIDDGIKMLLGRYTPPLDSGQANQLYEGIVDLGAKLDRLYERDAGDIVAVHQSDWADLKEVITALVSKVEDTNARLDRQAAYLREVLPTRA